MRYPQYSQYERILKRWAKKLFFFPLFVNVEIDSIGKLHVHGMAQARPNYLLRRLNTKKYSVAVIPIDSETEFNRVYKYCYKESQNDNIYEQENFISEYEIKTSPYPFI